MEPKTLSEVIDDGKRVEEPPFAGTVVRVALPVQLEVRKDNE